MKKIPSLYIFLYLSQQKGYHLQLPTFSSPLKIEKPFFYRKEERLKILEQSPLIFQNLFALLELAPFNQGD
jgi:hypothetical protein